MCWGGLERQKTWKNWKCVHNFQWRTFLWKRFERKLFLVAKTDEKWGLFFEGVVPTCVVRGGCFIWLQRFRPPPLEISFEKRLALWITFLAVVVSNASKNYLKYISGVAFKVFLLVLSLFCIRIFCFFSTVLHFILHYCDTVRQQLSLE